MKKITMINIDDWEVLYGPDGDKITEGHSIDGEQMFRALKNVNSHPIYLDMEYEYIKDSQMVDDLFGDGTPNNLSEIREYQETHK
jgi:hypothetical protein